MSMIEVRHLYKSFEQKGSTVEALRDVSLQIEAGDIYGIIGMSGAGQKYAGAVSEFSGTPDGRRGADRGEKSRGSD